MYCSASGVFVANNVYLPRRRRQGPFERWKQEDESDEDKRSCDRTSSRDGVSSNGLRLLQGSKRQHTPRPKKAPLSHLESAVGRMNLVSASLNSGIEPDQPSACMGDDEPWSRQRRASFKYFGRLITTKQKKGHGRHRRNFLGKPLRRILSQKRSAALEHGC